MLSYWHFFMFVVKQFQVMITFYEVMKPYSTMCYIFAIYYTLRTMLCYACQILGFKCLVVDCFWHPFTFWVPKLKILGPPLCMLSILTALPTNCNCSLFMLHLVVHSGGGKGAEGGRHPQHFYALIICPLISYIIL